MKQKATLVLKPQVIVNAPPGSDGLGKLLEQLVEAAKLRDPEVRFAALEKAQKLLMEFGLPEGTVEEVSRDLLVALWAKSKSKIPDEHRLTIIKEEK